MKSTIIIVKYPYGVNEIMFNNFLEKEMEKIAKKSLTRMTYKVTIPPQNANFLDIVKLTMETNESRPKSKWIDEGTNYCCLECGRECWVNSNYCPWCGADMRGEE